MRGAQCPHCGFCETHVGTIDPSGNREAAELLLVLGCSGLLFAVPLAWVMADNTLGAPLVVGVISLLAMIIALAWMRGRPSDPPLPRVWICENCLRTWDYQP
jgi:hypothetical protein